MHQCAEPAERAVVERPLGWERPAETAVQLLALAEGLADHVLTELHSARAARRQVLDALATAVEPRGGS